MGGLPLWIAYLLLDQKRLAWATVAVLVIVALLGLMMAVRWIRCTGPTATPARRLREATLLLERSFPLPVVVAHGLLAVTTLILVLFTMLGSGGD
jgi:hypothetical protein